MESFDTGSENSAKQGESAQPAIIGRVEDLQPGQAMTVQVANFGEVTLYNVNGDFYATESLCPFALIVDPQSAFPHTSPSLPIASTGQHVSASSQAAISSFPSGCLKTNE